MIKTVASSTGFYSEDSTTPRVDQYLKHKRHKMSKYADSIVQDGAGITTRW